MCDLLLLTFNNHSLNLKHVHGKTSLYITCFLVVFDTKAWFDLRWKQVKLSSVQTIRCISETWIYWDEILRCLSSKLASAEVAHQTLRAEWRAGRPPCGSLYKSMLIYVICCTTRKPCSKHHRKSSPFRVGRRKPGPGYSGAAPMSALRSVLLQPTAWPAKPTIVA